PKAPLQDSLRPLARPSPACPSSAAVAEGVLPLPRRSGERCRAQLDGVGGRPVGASEAMFAPSALPMSVRGGCRVVPPLRLGFAEPPLPPPEGEERCLAGAALTSTNYPSAQVCKMWRARLGGARHGRRDIRPISSGRRWPWRLRLSILP